MHGLRDIRVVDFSTGIAGAYCTKLMADAGADVIKVEPCAGDPLRRWSATGTVPVDEDGALFRFLNASKRSVVGEPEDREVQALVASADLVVESFETPRIDATDWCARNPGLVVLSITPWGRTGPYAGRPWSEFTVQAESGLLSVRGRPEHPPLRAGGRITEWVGGTFSAVSALAAVHRAKHTGHGEHVDFSLLEVMNIAAAQYADPLRRLSGDTDLEKPARSCETPSIEPTADGYIGVNTNSNQQFQSFLLLIERPDLIADESLALYPERRKRWEWWNETVHAYTRTQPTADLIERASPRPYQPISDAESADLGGRAYPTGPGRPRRPRLRVQGNRPDGTQRLGRVEDRDPSRGPIPSELPVFSLQIRDSPAETGSLSTVPTGIQSAVAESLRARIQEQPERFPRFRRVLRVRLGRIRTGDCWFRAW